MNKQQKPSAAAGHAPAPWICRPAKFDEQGGLLTPTAILDGNGDTLILFGETPRIIEQCIATINLLISAPRMLEVLKKAKRLRSLECTILTNRKLDALGRNELRREANRIEDEINDVVAKAEGEAL